MMQQQHEDALRHQCTSRKRYSSPKDVVFSLLTPRALPALIVLLCIPSALSAGICANASNLISWAGGVYPHASSLCALNRDCPTCVCGYVSVTDALDGVDKGLTDAQKLQVYKWAERKAEENIKPVVDSNPRLEPGWLEAAWERLTRIRSFNPFDRTAAIKVVDGKMYVIAHSSIDHFPGGMLVKAWLRDLMRMIAWILQNRPALPDFEGLFTCSARAEDVGNLLPGVIMLSHCYNNTKLDRMVPMPRTYAMFFYKDLDLLKLDRRPEALRANIMSKAPKAVFRGALSGPARVALFKVGKADRERHLVDIGMTAVPMGAPCMGDEGHWCLHAPLQWVEQYNLRLSEPMSPTLQMGYRYTVVADGVGCADRLATNRMRYFAGETIALWARSTNTEFWYSDLQPWKHYIPVKPDYSDLVDKVKLLNKNASLVMHVARNARDYGSLYLRRYSWITYAEAILRRYAKLFDYKVEIPPCAVRMMLMRHNDFHQ